MKNYIQTQTNSKNKSTSRRCNMPYNSTWRRDNTKNKYPSTKVILYFPDSSCGSFKFEFSLNEAKQSGFLEAIINGEEGNKNVIEILIPSTLYLKTRDVDLEHFYYLWKGRQTVEPLYIKYDYKQIYELTNAFCLNVNLPFVKELSSKFNN